MADQISLEAESRTALGKKTGALRRAGITPIHVYGRGTESLTLQADTHDLVRALNRAGHTTPLTVKVGSDEHFVMVRDIQTHPVTAGVIHVDFFQVSRTERIHALVPLHFEGDALGARDEGASLSEDLHEIEVEALPNDVPHGFTVDVSVMTAPDSAILAKDIALPSGVTLITDPGAPIARIVHRRGAEVEEAEEGVAPAAVPSSQASAEQEPAAEEE